MSCKNCWTLAYGQDPCGLLYRMTLLSMPWNKPVSLLCVRGPYIYWPSWSAIDPSLLTTPSEIMADTVKRSPAAILFHFYTALCEIASIPRRTPSTWTSTNGIHKPDPNHPRRDSRTKINRYQSVEDVLELDARVLARDCLKVLGQEMGVARWAAIFELCPC